MEKKIDITNPERNGFSLDYRCHVLVDGNYVGTLYGLTPEEAQGNARIAASGYLVEELKDVIENRIKELNKADADFCKDRWDMSKPQMERDLYRGFSNEVTFARKEFENLLKLLTKATNTK